MVDSLLIDDNQKEFNSQIEFFKLLYRVMERRNIAYESGDFDSFYRSTMSLLLNSAGKLDKENIDINILYKRLETIWNKVVADERTNNKMLINSNKKSYEFELVRLNSELMGHLIESGIIYPKKFFKTIKQAREEDY